MARAKSTGITIPAPEPQDSLVRMLRRPIPGLSERTRKIVASKVGPAALDVLLRLPAGLLDHRSVVRITDAAPGDRIAIRARVIDRVSPNRNSNQPWRIVCSDGQSVFDLIYFRAHFGYMTRLFPVETPDMIIVGTVGFDDFRRRPKMDRPDVVIPATQPQPGAEPVYPLGGDLTAEMMRDTVRRALGTMPILPEWAPAARVEAEGWASWDETLIKAHNPSTQDDVSPLCSSRRRLAYDELLAQQLHLNFMRAGRGTRKAPGKSSGALRAQALAAMPFALTGAQSRSLADIERDMAGEVPMLRLLLGDVGSGKTAVALMAMLIAIERGQQAALIAPTEILATQHADGLARFAEACNFRLALLTGRERKAARDAVTASLARGEIDLVIGTHALIESSVTFARLGCAVIDEQHRFGVDQRRALASKGEGTDVLAMTATPIPRTLAIAAYGDLDVSILDEKPAGRKPVETRVMPVTRVSDLTGRLRTKTLTGERAFWICPLVEDGKNSPLVSAETRVAALRAALGKDKVGLVHGKMPGAEKEAAMQAFATGQLAVLVATTVVEVGVNVPEATVIVVEHAERFGLSQLHQLRGRVGRGNLSGSCILLHSEKLTDGGRARLMALRETDDGFRLAKMDLKQRGPGELLGTKQSGSSWRLADFTAHADLVEAARDDARAIFAADPRLASGASLPYRMLLEIFPAPGDPTIIGGA